jgi:hypothetical protein
MKAETIGCPGKSIINYDYSLSDNQKGRGLTMFGFFPTIKYSQTFVKTNQIIPQFKYKHNRKATRSVDIYVFRIKTNHKMFVLQDISCSHEVRGKECGQVLRRGAGSISTSKVSRFCIFD